MHYNAVTFEVVTATYLSIYVVSQTCLQADSILVCRLVGSVLTAVFEHAYNSWICQR